VKTDSLWRLSGLRGTNPLKTTVVGRCCKMSLQKQYRCPGLFKSSRLTWPHFIFAKDRYWYFCFHKKRQKVKTVLSICFAVSPYRGSEGDTASSVPQEGHSASRHHRCGPYLWASALYLDLFCLPVSKMCPQTSEKPKRGIFWVLEFQKFFKYKLMFKKFSI